MSTVLVAIQVVIAIVVYFIFKNDRDSLKRSFYKDVESKFPYRNIDNINSYKAENINLDSLKKNTVKPSVQIHENNKRTLEVIVCPTCKKETQYFEKNKYQNCSHCNRHFQNPNWANITSKKTSIEDLNVIKEHTYEWIKTREGLVNLKDRNIILLNHTILANGPPKYGYYVYSTETKEKFIPKEKIKNYRG